MITIISIIIPCYGSQHTIAAVVADLTKTLGTAEYEIILVNDSSPDGVFAVIKDLCGDSRNIKGLDLSKNFGQHNAIMAGLSCATGDICVFMDDDGQTPATEIWQLINALDNETDIVIAEYANKKHSHWRNWGSKINDRMAEILINKPRNLKMSSYFAIKKFVADELRNYQGSFPYLAGLLLRSGNRIKNVPIPHKPREIGQSGYTFKKLIGLWLNGFTAFSVKPLRIATFMGFLTAMGGFTYGIYVILRRLIFEPLSPMGWSSTMAALLFIGGMIMLMLGLIGEYVGRIYININNSPQFVIREKLGFDRPEEKRNEDED